MKRNLVLGFVGLLAANAALAASITVTFQDGLDGYMGTSDTELREQPSTAGTPQGDATGISIDGADPSPYDTNGLIKFADIFGAALGQIPTDGTLISAELKLNVNNEGSGLKVHRMFADWDENATWNSMVGGISADDFEAAMAFDASVGADNGSANVPTGVLSLNVLPSVTAWQAGAMNYGWALLPFSASGTNGIDFRTSEYSTVSARPQLVVSYEPIPEPTTAGLLLIGLAAALRRSRA